MGRENENNDTEQLYPYQSYEEQLFSEPSVLEQQNMYNNAIGSQYNNYNPNLSGQANVHNYTTGSASPKKSGKNNRKKLIITIASVSAVIICLVFVLCLFLYNRPEKKLERCLEAADELFEKSNYGEALDEYKKALDIDNESVNAMAGAVKCYEYLDNIDEYQKFYSESADTISEMSSDEIEDNMEDIVFIYCKAPSVYGDETEKYLDILEEGYVITDNNTDICALITAGYIDLAEECHANGDLDATLDSYDAALAYDITNEDALNGLSATLNELLNSLINNNCLDEALSYIDKYENAGYSFTSVNFSGYRDKIDDKRLVADLVDSVMFQAHNMMSAKNYDGMYELDGSDNANTVAGSIEDYMIYTESGNIDNNYTGTATGMYLFDYGGYAFYYGGYENGQRTGYGVYFMKVNNEGTYDVFEGQWADDAPNGEGTFTEKGLIAGEDVLDIITTGNFSTGYQDGDFTSYFVCDGVTYTGTWTAETGMIGDVAASFPDCDFSSVPDSHIVYVVYEAEDESAGYFWRSINENGRLGLFAEFN